MNLNVRGVEVQKRKDGWWIVQEYEDRDGDCAIRLLEGPYETDEKADHALERWLR